MEKKTLPPDDKMKHLTKHGHEVLMSIEGSQCVVKFEQATIIQVDTASADIEALLQVVDERIEAILTAAARQDKIQYLRAVPAGTPEKVIELRAAMDWCEQLASKGLSKDVHHHVHVALNKFLTDGIGRNIAREGTFEKVISEVTEIKWGEYRLGIFEDAGYHGLVLTYI